MGKQPRFSFSNSYLAHRNRVNSVQSTHVLHRSFCFSPLKLELYFCLSSATTSILWSKNAHTALTFSLLSLQLLSNLHLCPLWIILLSRPAFSTAGFFFYNFSVQMVYRCIRSIIYYQKLDYMYGIYLAFLLIIIYHCCIKRFVSTTLTVR